MVKFFSLLFILFVFFCCASRFSSSPRDQGRGNAPAEQRLWQAARAWLGTPYRYGGQSKRGVDCSGLVQQIYRELFNMRLPRTVAELAREGRFVRPPWLEPGDLIFFRTTRSGNIDHVGIYLGQDKFLHASGEQGVIISDINESYFRNRLALMRRYLP